MQISFTIPDAQVPRFIAAMCDYHHYPAKIADPQDATKEIDNTETRAQFAKRMVGEYLKKRVDAYERRKVMLETVTTAIDVS